MSKMKDQWAGMNGQYESFNMYEMKAIQKKKKDKENKNGNK